MYSNFRLFRLSMAMVLIVLGLTSVASAQITFINPVNADSTTNDHISGSRHIAAVPDGSGGYVAVGFYRDNDAIAELKFVYDLENATGGQSVQSISEGSDLVILGNLYRDENDKVHAVYMAAGTLKYRNNIALATQLQSPGGIGSGTVTDGLNASFAFPSVAFHATGDGNTDKSGVGGIIYRGTGGIEVQKFSLDASGFFSHDGSPIDVTTDNTGLRPHVGTSSSGDLVITYMRNGNLYMADDVQAAGFNNEALIQADPAGGGEAAINNYAMAVRADASLSVVYQEAVADNEDKIYFERVNFSTRTDLSQLAIDAGSQDPSSTTAAHLNPSIALDSDGAFHVAFSARNSAGTRHIYYTNNVTPGSFLAHVEVNPTDPIGNHNLSAISVESGSKAHVAFADNGSTILYARTNQDVTAPSGPVLRVNDVTMTETDNGETIEVVLTISLDQAATGQVSVDVNTADGTAVAGTDYTAVDGTITIPAGQTERKLTPLLLTFVPQPPSEPDCALLKPFPGQGDRPSQQ